mmetsp:Transcript_11417/g.24356  ORF Transcript_11417/g.24356 Transcript_11417/m.24356 type:complete len:126 (-) Transcript_11417:3386-3763(-)
MAAKPSQPTRRKNARRQPHQADATSATHQAQSITTSLLRTKNLMSQELDRVSTLNTTIDDDGALLHDAKEEHAGMGGTMKGAKKVMGRLGRQDVRDAVILKCAVGFYWVVVAYVLWSRIKVPFLP